MANQTAKITGFVVREAAKGFHNTALYSSLVEKGFDSTFGQEGAKKGDTIYVRNPVQYRVRKGAKMKTQYIAEDVIKVTLPEQKGVDYQFDVRELTLDVDNNKTDYSKRFVRPAGETLAADTDAEGLADIQRTAGSTVVVPAGANKYDAFLKAKAMLNKMLAPKGIGNRYAIVGSDVETDLSKQVSTLFNAAADITKAIKEGVITGVGGLTWGSSDLVKVHVNGAGGQSITLGSAIVPDYKNRIQNIPATAAGLKVGDTIEFNAHFVNPETKGIYADKLQRKVLSIDNVNGTVEVYAIRPSVFATPAGVFIANEDLGLADGSSAADAKAIDKATAADLGSLEPEEARKQLAMANCDIIPTSGVVLGVAGASYVSCPVFQKSAVKLTSVDLVKPSKTEASDRLHFENMSIRYVRDYSISDDVLPDRLDMLDVFTTMRPEWAVSVEIEI